MNLFYFLAIPLLLSVAQAQTISVRVLKVHDGDTFVAQYDSLQIPVRLSMVDCPEKGSPYWKVAKAFTTDHILGKTVTLTIKGRDSFNRHLAVVLLPDNRNLNELLVSEGLACRWRDGQPDTRLDSLEADARARKAGFWQQGGGYDPCIR